MEELNNLMHGFSVAMTLPNLWASWCSASRWAS